MTEQHANRAPAVELPQASPSGVLKLCWAHIKYASAVAIGGNEPRAADPP